MTIKLSTISQGCERRVVRVVLIKDDQTEVFETIDLSGNSTSEAFWGALLAVKAVNELLSKEMGWSDCLDRVRASVLARAEGRQEGGDVVVMEAIDKIVEREGWLNQKAT